MRVTSRLAAVDSRVLPWNAPSVPRRLVISSIAASTMASESLAPEAFVTLMPSRLENWLPVTPTPPTTTVKPDRPKNSGTGPVTRIDTTPKPERPPVEQPKPDQPKPDQPKPDVVKAGNGVLKLGSKPRCEIYIDGSSTGLFTPQLNLKLSAGKHRITLVNNEFGIRETFSVDIKADDTEKVTKDYSDRLPK